MPRPAILLAPLLAASASPATAQELLGRVIESPSGRAIGGIAVRLYRVAVDSASTEAGIDVPLRTVLTAADGAFALFPPGPGTYRVRVGTGALAPAVTLAADSSDQRVYAIPLDFGVPLYPAQVDQAVRAVPGTVRVSYPMPLMQAQVTGCAAVELVVDTAGRAEQGSVRPVAATRPEFVQVGVDAITKARFHAAVRDGRPVRAMAVVPFEFHFAGAPAPDRRPCDVAGGGTLETIIVTAGYGSPPPNVRPPKIPNMPLR